MKQWQGQAEASLELGSLGVFGQYSKMIAKAPEIVDAVHELIQEDPAMRKYAEEKGLV